jgi:hypothetical protein
MSNEKRVEERGTKTMLWAVLFVVVLAFSALAWSIHENEVAIKQAHRALCTLQADRNAKVTSAEAILNHPEDPGNLAILKTFGRPLIVRSLITARADAKAYRDIKCSGS